MGDLAVMTRRAGDRRPSETQQKNRHEQGEASHAEPTISPLPPRRKPANLNADAWSRRAERVAPAKPVCECRGQRQLVATEGRAATERRLS